MTDRTPDHGPLFAVTFAASPTTSGPRPPSADGPRATRDYAEQWAAFAASYFGAPIAEWIEREAVYLYAEGAERISSKALIEGVRGDLRAAISSNWSAPIADWLVARHPHLSDRIERRVRKATIQPKET